jgi:hypothetical protein
MVDWLTPRASAIRRQLHCLMPSGLLWSVAAAVHPGTGRKHSRPYANPCQHFCKGWDQVHGCALCDYPWTRSTTGAKFLAVMGKKLASADLSRRRQVLDALYRAGRATVCHEDV